MRVSTLIKVGQAVYYLAQIIRPAPEIKMPEPPLYGALKPSRNMVATTSAATSSSELSLPTTKETLHELKRRLGKELYRMELDLMAGARISGKPCDCLGKKHTFGLEAIAEELMAYEKNPVYLQIIAWLKQHESEFEPETIAKRAPEYYIGLVPEVRNFRKRVMGTENAGALLTEEERNRVKQKALEILNKTLETKEETVSSSG